jgi:hypothetical protein
MANVMPAHDKSHVALRTLDQRGWIGIGYQETQEALVRGVEQWLQRPLGTDRFQTGSSQFDGEWFFLGIAGLIGPRPDTAPFENRNGAAMSSSPREKGLMRATRTLPPRLS